MPDIGPLELVIILVIVLLIVGPKKLPGLGRSLGSGMKEFKDSITGDHKDDRAELPQTHAPQQPVAQPVAPQPQAVPVQQPAAPAPQAAPPAQQAAPEPPALAPVPPVPTHPAPQAPAAPAPPAPQPPADPAAPPHDREQ